MISPLQDTLIGLYAQGSVEAVHALQEYQDLCRNNKDNRTFDAERAVVEEMLPRRLAKVSRNGPAGSRSGIAAYLGTSELDQTGNILRLGPTGGGPGLAESTSHLLQREIACSDGSATFLSFFYQPQFRPTKSKPDKHES